MSKDTISLSHRFDASTIGNKWAYLIDNLLSGKKGDDLKEVLNKELAYTVSSGLELSKLIFNEFDHVSKKLVDMQDSAYHESLVRGSYYRRLKFSISQEGKKETVRKIIRKAYHKSGGRRLIHSLKKSKPIRH